MDQLAHMVLALKAQGVSVLLSEQNLPFAARVCDRAYVLEKGVVRFHDSMQALHADTAAWHAFLGL
jgi:branched-chain amino acid transport system ATP-binding protein